MAPLILTDLWKSRLVLAGDAAPGAMSRELEGTIGHSAAQAISKDY